MRQKTRDEGETACHCCGLLASDQGLRSWRERRLCRQLSALEPRHERTADEWTSGLYRYYYVTHDHRVCEACHDHLQAGGQFAGAARNRSKQAFLILLAILAIIIVSLPILLPVLKSAFWLAPEEGN
jgi:hypothetical protein